MVLTANGIKDMFVTNGGLLKVQNASLAYFGRQRFTSFGGLLSNVGGEVWKRKRHALDPAFHKKYLHSLLPMMNEMTSDLIKQLKEEARTHDLVDLELYMKKSALLLIGSIGYGMDLTNRADYSMGQLLGLMDDMLKGYFGEVMDPFFMHKPSNSHLIKRTEEAGRVLRYLGHDALKRRREKLKQNEETPVDLLAHSLNIQENNPWYSDEEVVDDFVTFIVAGFETTSGVLCFVLALLARHPGVASWAAQEVIQLLNEKQFLDKDDLGQLNYLECVIKETMRLYPVVSLVRRTTSSDILIDGQVIPKDTQVMYPPFIQGRLEEVWEDPYRFKPERFLTNPSTFSYLPFLVGPRKCIGNTFAMNEMKIVVGQILQTFELRAPSDQEIDPQFKMTLYPKVGTQIRLRERSMC